MTDGYDDLIRAARFGVEIEDGVNGPVFKFVLLRLAERAEDALEALTTLDPDTEAPKIRAAQALIARFRAMQQDIEQVINEGRQAHRTLVENERIEDA